MCGIIGLWILNGEPRLRRLIKEMTETLHHRGPDAGGVFQDPETGVALGHRRLAILDLSERGAQPMHSACGRYVISFNGEIYNHLALRKDLESCRSVDWRTTSDTETLVECFASWGVAATLKRAVGMFAIALWDRRERALTLARDRFGEKPLYYGFVGQGTRTSFVFGSELKALRAHPDFDNPIDKGSLDLFLRFSYVPAPYSIYQDVSKLEPGSILSISAGALAKRAPQVERYWSYPAVVAAARANPVKDEREGLALLQKALEEAVAGQLIADVPVGAFLSGGVDSSTVVALIQAQSSRAIKTFTVGFEEAGFDEAPFARKVAKHLGTDHSELYVTPKDTQAVIPSLPEMYDEPFGDSSQIPTSIICKAARREVTVALSGDAGDEMLGGYHRYILGPKLTRSVQAVPGPLRKPLGQIIRKAMDLSPVANGLLRFKDKIYKLEGALHRSDDADWLYRALVTVQSEETRLVPGAPRLPTLLDRRELAKGLSAPEERMMLLDSLTYLPDDILTKVDRAAMAVGLETRIPMLDHHVAEICWRLPLAMKIRNGKTKWALRQILYKHVPATLIERPKAGFAIPIGLWIRGPLRDWAETLLAPSRIRSEGYLEPSIVQELWRDHRSARRNCTEQLWNYLMFQAWLETQTKVAALA